jgi:hypothetical protein
MDTQALKQKPRLRGRALRERTRHASRRAPVAGAATERWYWEPDELPPRFAAEEGAAPRPHAHAEAAALRWYER